jgi:hypothetical protein
MTQITLKDVYDVVDRVECKLDKIEGRVSVIEIWKADLIGKLSIISAVVIIGGNLAFDWIKTKFKNL